MSFAGRAPCPLCRSEGRDSKGDHLALFNDGKGGWCRIHSYVKLEGGEVAEQRYERKPTLDVAIINKLPIRELTTRGISRETAERFGIRVSIDEVTGEVDAHHYPYFSVEGNEIVGYKKRTLPKSFSVIGKTRGLFGQQLCKGGKFLCIFEGELDACFAWELLQKEGKGFNCVSLPNGANEEGKLDQTTLREIEWITSFEGVAICLDNDGPGKATALALAELLASQTKVKVVTLPFKDAGEMHARGLSKEFLKCLYDAKAYHPESVVEGSELKPEDYRKNKEPGAILPYPRLQKMTWGIRKGEITLVVSGPGLGKSTFVREVCFDLSMNGYKIANIALETPMNDLVNTYVAMDNNIPPYKLMFNQSILPEKDYNASFEKLYSTNNMNFFSWWGNIASDRLINKLNYFAKSLSVDFIMLDHISIAVSGEDDERLEIDRLFEKLTSLVVETGVGVLAVMHLRKVPGKSFNRGGEVELEDIRGSAGAAQMSWNVWALERDQQGENKDVLQVRVLKNRALGFTGVADQLIFNHETGRLDVLSTEY